MEATSPLSGFGDAAMPDQWWTAFDDSVLNEQVDTALTDNFDLAAAWQRLRQARSIVQRERADLFPALDGLAGAEVRGGDDNDQQTEFSAGLEASYEWDLWGRIESRVEAERFRASATLADYHTASLSLAAEVAVAWYRRVEARLQLALIQRQVDVNEKVLELLRTRFAAGQSRSPDVLRQRELIETTKQQAVVQRARIAVLEHQLAVLQGMAPQSEIVWPERDLPELPPSPSTGVAAELVQRRPDVQRALLRVKAADRELASAVSDQYPRIALTASLSSAAEHPEDLFREWLVSLAGQVTAPLFDAGQRRAEVERTEALRQEAVDVYGQTVIEAFREVEDALSQEQYQAELLTRIRNRLALARQTYEQLRTQYLNGVTDYIAVLTALTDQQQLERDLLAAERILLEQRITLYRALAGRFETPTEREMNEDKEQGASDG